MIKRLLAIAVLGVTLSGCFMAPLALIGPAASGFSTASLIQSGVSTGANYMVKKSTGKTISEHVMQSLKTDVIEQSYAPKENEPEKIFQGWMISSSPAATPFEHPIYDVWLKECKIDTDS